LINIDTISLGNTSDPRLINVVISTSLIHGCFFKKIFRLFSVAAILREFSLRDQ